MKTTVGQYYKGFISLRGLLSAVPVVGPPLLGACAPDLAAFSQNLYPPLGDFQQLALGFTVALLLAVTVVIYGLCPIAQGRRRRVYIILAIVSLLVGSFFLALCDLYVIRVVTGSKQEIVLSIGYQRADWVQRKFPNASDETLLEKRGPWEKQIHALWTPSSVAVVRVLLWFTYTLFLAGLLAIASIIVYQHATETANSKTGDSNPPDSA